MRKAMEALGFSSSAEAAAVIAAGFKHHDPQWIASALLAMGRAGDNQWDDQVIESLTHENNDIRRAAVGAAGELRLDDARPILLHQLDEGEDDEEVFRATLWALSQIGGEDVRPYLENLLDNEDDDLVEFVEEALENLEFTEELNKFDLLAFDPDLDEEDLIELDELDIDADVDEVEPPKTAEQKPARKKHKKTSK
jgi:HEAT repeat protein